MKEVVDVFNGIQCRCRFWAEIKGKTPSHIDATSRIESIDHSMDPIIHALRKLKKKKDNVFFDYYESIRCL